MKTDVWTKLGLASAATEYSQAVMMDGDNAISLTITVFAGTLAASGVSVWESNDLENWQQRGGVAFANQGVGSAMAISGYSAIASAYIRFKVTAGAAPVVMSLTANTAHL